MTDIALVLLYSALAVIAFMLVLIIVKISGARSKDIEKQTTNASLLEDLKIRLETIRLQHQQQIESQQSQHNQEIEKIRRQYEQQLEELRRQQAEVAEAMRRETVAQFKALSAEIIKDNTESLKRSNTEQIESILKPLSQNITDFKNAVNTTYVNENASRKSLTDQIDRLMKLNETIGSEARNLTSALKNNSKVQGDWGEMILESMLESAGLTKDVHYQVQASTDDAGNVIRDENGKIQRPDIIINMPDERKLVIDSKVSLKAFVDLCGCDDTELKQKFLNEHLASVRRHIDELSVKKYQNNVRNSADYVMMFIPNEGAYIAAVQEDSNLWKYAYDRRVALVSPTHLFSVMRIVSQLWVQDKQNKNTIKIAQKGGALYDKVVLFMTSMKELGDSLAKASSAYDTSLSRLSSGKGNILRTSEELKLMGVKASKQMPSKFTDMLEEDINTDSSESEFLE